MVLGVGYIVFRLIRTAVRKLLVKFGFDRRLARSNGGAYIAKFSPRGEPSRLVSGLVFWLLFLFVIFAAIGNLRIAALTRFMNAVLYYIPNVIAAAAILIIAGIIAGVLRGAVSRSLGDTPTARMLRSGIPALVMSIAVFMALVQLKISMSIVQITYGALMFALALGAALAFGLGGRDVASRMMNNAYENTDMAKLGEDFRSVASAASDGQRDGEASDGSRSAQSSTGSVRRDE